MSSSKSNISTLALASTTAAAVAFYFLKGSSTSTSKTTKSSSTDKSSSNALLLVGDIGGTNTRLALFKPDSASAGAEKSPPLYEKEYLNSQFITSEGKSFEQEIFLPFLRESKLSLSDNNAVIIACFAVAGPVSNNSVVMTNLLNASEIELNGDKIEASAEGELACIKRCKIINDFVGQGYGLLDLDLSTEVKELIPGSLAKIQAQDNANTGPKCCLGAGTGLGECYLTTSSFHPEEGYECYASEGGHVDYAPRSDLEVELVTYLKDKFNQPSRLSVERVVSGKGLANVYEFLSKKFPKKVNPSVHEEFEKAGDMQGRVVGVNANNKGCVLCVQAMEIMMAAYGAEAGNCAVKFIPTGGCYVSGGLTPKNIDFIAGVDSPFMRAYHDKGRLSGLVASIPLLAVLVEDIGKCTRGISYLVVQYHLVSYQFWFRFRLMLLFMNAVISIQCVRPIFCLIHFELARNSHLMIMY